MTEGAISAENNLTSLAADAGTISNVVAQHCAVGNLYHGTNEEAASDGALVVAGLRSGVLTTIDACVKILDATVKFKDNVEAVTAFLGPLVNAKIVSPSEARLGFASDKLSRLKKIGEYADQLRHEKIVEYFLETGRSGPTLVYQVAVLFDLTPEHRTDDERIEELVNTLRREQVETRHDMLRLTRETKQAKRESNTGTPIPSPVDKTHEAAAVVNASYDLVLAVPRGPDLRKLGEYQSTGPLPRCLRIGGIMADDATLVVLARLSDLAVIEDKLLPGCGFEDASRRVFLIHVPADPEITEAQVLIVAERGSGGRAHFGDIAWLSREKPVDPFALAVGLVADAKKKLVLFASVETDDWYSILGEANWSNSGE